MSPSYLLTFDPLSRRFDLVYQSLLLSPIGLRSAAERRLHGELLTTLESIAQPKVVRDEMGGPREYLRDEQVLYECVGGGQVRVSKPELDLIIAHARATINMDSFAKALSREGQACLDWLDALKPEAELTATE